ncbi:leupaxin [Pimephales promelas]|nr:leupaxin [Pimephales promelas]
MYQITLPHMLTENTQRALLTSHLKPQTTMDELDMLLEQLAQNSTQTSSVPAPIPPKPFSLEASVKSNNTTQFEQIESSCLVAGGGQKCDNAYSMLPAPVEAGVMSPGTATRELDSIMNELLGLGLEMITALGQVWHPEHFVCTTCREEFGSSGFFERDGKPYCEKDYQNLFSPRCAYCKGPITQNILTAMDQTWHPEHFFCSHCGDLFGPDGYMEKDGKPYCSRDFYRLFAPKCSGCGEPVKDNYLSAANGTWHPDCFVCADCLKPFTDGCFLELNGRPLCSLHYHSRQGTLCGTCGEPISGRCISALDRKFHPDHFVCAFCLRQLSQGVFKEQGGKPYCSVCHTKLFV